MDLRRLTRLSTVWIVWGWGEGHSLGLHTDGSGVRKTREKRVLLPEAGEGAHREEQGRRGVELDRVAQEVPWDLQEACRQSQAVRQLGQRDRMVLVWIGALGCKQ